jgi:hypothetical protein
VQRFSETWRSGRLYVRVAHITALGWHSFPVVMIWCTSLLSRRCRYLLFRGFSMRYTWLHRFPLWCLWSGCYWSVRHCSISTQDWFSICEYRHPGHRRNSGWWRRHYLHRRCSEVGRWGLRRFFGRSKFALEVLYLACQSLHFRRQFLVRL